MDYLKEDDDENKNQPICLSDQIRQKYSWERETCYDTTLFISTFGENLFIIEYTIFPSIHLNKRWPSSIICKENQVISDMKSNENNHGRFILVKDGLIDVHL
ncbi:unnamed protein product [Rotaria sp. Silwood1]|nr:unnamed protein product [Rotaria sp. Silwood1]CAF3673210.1 unnamed protein product [Rotaria sp. Silwood1]CAF4905294.1 unnamed protein product [Rotaria sp. Silwood1]CAF4943970.1 unnamed protein product [Rotaria sp. Silwood1]CAF5102894.1 unnamed protein product [Rotaria sp. Silwood1]